MEKENRAFFNSPAIRKNTPIKRLGLSRKRKSCGTESSSCAKIPAFNEKSLSSPSHIEVDKQIINNASDSENDENNPTVNYDKEIELLKLVISEKEEKLKTLQCNKDKIEQLENLINLWKNGCKNAFLHFSQLVKDRESDNFDLKSVLNNLGILMTMVENFQDDSEISSLENSQ